MIREEMVRIDSLLRTESSNKKPNDRYQPDKRKKRKDYMPYYFFDRLIHLYIPSLSPPIIREKVRSERLAQMTKVMIPITEAILKLLYSLVSRNSQVISRSTSFALELARAMSVVV